MAEVGPAFVRSQTVASELQAAGFTRIRVASALLGLVYRFDAVRGR